jgi:prolipoprotein diacylglyceryl transferase
MYPKLISIGSFFIPTYGVLVALGFLAGLMVTMRLASRAGLSAEKVTNLAVYCAIAGVVGAKLFMFLFDFSYYAQNPGEIFTLSTLQAAGVFHGGFIAALIVAALYMRQQKLPVLQTMDIFAPGVAIGQAIGRLGCFAAGCCWGRECDLPWGVRFHWISRSIPFSFTSLSAIFCCSLCSTNSPSAITAPARLLVCIWWSIRAFAFASSSSAITNNRLCLDCRSRNGSRLRCWHLARSFFAPRAKSSPN